MSTLRDIGQKKIVEHIDGFLLVIVALVLVFSASAVTIRRSFRTREAGFGFGTGTATVAYPVDAKIDKAIDEAWLKEAEKTKVIIGKVTRVSDGDTIHVVTGGNEKYKVRLDRIDAPESDQPYGKESAVCLSKLINGRTVRVEWVKKDQYGRILGIVYLDSIKQSNTSNNQTIRQDVNLTMVATGNAWHYSYFDKTAEYASAEVEARQNRRGLWSADEKPVNLYEWRRSKRKM